MKVAILDDYFDTLRTLPCFAKLAGHDVTVWNDHVQDVDALAERLQRHRGARADPRADRRSARRCSSACPTLRLISQRSVYPHIDVDACTRLGIVVSSDQHAGTPSYAAAELTWGLVLAAVRQIPQQMASLRSGQLADGRRQHAARQDAGHLRLRADRPGGRRLRAGVRDAGPRLGARGVARSARAPTATPSPRARRRSSRDCDVLSLHMRLVDATRGIVTAADLARHEADARCSSTPAAPG